MYNLNTRQGKEERIKELGELMIKVSRNNLNADDQRAIFQYLQDIQIDLKSQLFEECLYHIETEEV